MLTRRNVLRLGLASALTGFGLSLGCTSPRRATAGVLVNDVHSQFNATRVRAVHRPESLDALTQLLHAAARRNQAISIAGARHAMGGQQFGADTWLLDPDRLNHVHAVSQQHRVVEAEAGIRWPKLMTDLAAAQADSTSRLGIIQKQTGADELTVGGALAANIHGRGLTMAPIVADVESFVLLDAEGVARRCSRRENAELFRLAIGGYGLFGIITQVVLRLQPRQKLRRLVEIVEAEQVMPTLHRRIADGCRYGDFQYSIDPASDGFLTRGVLSCYQPVADETPMPDQAVGLSPQQWAELIRLAHEQPDQACERYTGHYLRTHGQLYWSDTNQMSTYDAHYHARLNELTQASVKATEMISELYVPREALAAFLRDAAALLREGPVPVIYGTVRLIERDSETFLAWARHPFACVIFNLHCTHTPEGIAQAKQAFRDLIDLAIRYDGSYYLTYHRWARREQVEQCYPQFGEFLKLKRQYDPQERFQSEWYRHYRAMFG